MKRKKLWSGILMVCMILSLSVPLPFRAGAAAEPETGVYVGAAALEPGQYLLADGTVTNTAGTVGEGNYVGYFEAGKLTLGGTATFVDNNPGAYAAIMGANGGRDLEIHLLDGANITLTGGSGTWRGGIYGNYQPVLITGDGTLTIRAEESQYGMIAYGKGGAASNDDITVTDGADVVVYSGNTVPDSFAVGFGSNADGNIRVENGASLTVFAAGKAFSKAPVTDGVTVTAGDSEAEAAPWDGTSDLTAYAYVKLAAAGGSGEEPEPEPEPEPGDPVYVGSAVIEPGQYLKSDGTTTQEPGTVGEGGYVGHFADGILTLGGEASFTEDPSGGKWGAIGSVKDGVPLTIVLEEGADITLHSASYSGIYGNYAPVAIRGKGMLTIEAQAAYGISVYGHRNDSQNPEGLTISDGAAVVVNGGSTSAVDISGKATGDVVVENGASLTVSATGKAFTKAPVTDGVTVTAGDSEAEAAPWDGTSDLTAYAYVKLVADGGSGEEPDDPDPEKPGVLPTEGTIWEETFEDAAIYDWEGANLEAMRIANGGIYRNIYNVAIDLAPGHGKVLKMPTDEKNNRGFDLYNKDLFGLDEEADINSGTVVFSQDVCIPSGMEFTQNDTTLYSFVYTYSKAGLSNNRDLAYLYSIEVGKDDTEGTVIFGTSENAAMLPADAGNNSFALAFDKWYNLEVVIDYEAGTVNYYVDGNRVATYLGSAENVARYFSIAYVGVRQGGKYTDSEKPVTFLFDNYKMAYVDAGFRAAAAGSGADYVDVQFSAPVSDRDLESVSASVRSTAGSAEPVAASKYEKRTADTVRYTFSGLAAGSMYELTFDQDIPAAYGGASWPAGSTVVFATPAMPQETTLLDMNFESVSLDQETSAGFSDFYLVHQTSADDTAFVEDKANTYYYATIAENGPSGKYLEYDHFLDWDGMVRNGLKFPFAKPVDSGTLTISFDAGVRGQAGRTRALYGLGDPGKTDVGWTPATVFGGITPYDGERLSFSKATGEYRNRLAADSSMDVTLALNQMEEMHHYRYVIDLDSSTYQIYYDNTLVADVDGFPGGATDNAFDSFYLSAIFYSSDYEANHGVTYLMLDNLKVTHSVSSPAVSSVTFVKYDGTESGFSAVQPAGTKSVRIGFTKEMDVDVTDYITVSGMEPDDYAVSYADRVAVITFADCLQPNTQYTITIGAAAADSAGNALGSPAVYTFTTDGGELEIGKPVIKVDGEAVDTLGTLEDGATVTAEVTVVNTANVPKAFWMTLAGYDAEGRLTSIVPHEAALTGEETYIHTVVVTGDIAKLKEAQQIAAFVFSDLTNIRPLTEAAKVGR